MKRLTFALPATLTLGLLTGCMQDGIPPVLRATVDANTCSTLLQEGDLKMISTSSRQSIEAHNKDKNDKVKPEKVLICHNPSGDETKGKTIAIPENALMAHIEQHNDTISPCLVEAAPDEPLDEDQVVETPVDENIQAEIAEEIDTDDGPEEAPDAEDIPAIEEPLPPIIDYEQVVEACQAAETDYTCESMMADASLYAEMEMLKPNQKEKVIICHTPPGNPDNPQTIAVAPNAAENHIHHHGDTLGPCEELDVEIEELLQEVCL